MRSDLMDVRVCDDDLVGMGGKALPIEPSVRQGLISFIYRNVPCFFLQYQGSHDLSRGFSLPSMSGMEEVPPSH